jgi:hypothetical protein
MYINSTNSFLHSAQEQNLSASKSLVKGSVEKKTIQLENFTEKANLTFDNMSFGLSEKEKNELADTLNSIGKAAAFASINGFESQEERNIVTQYFGNLSGVISDEAIKKMIFSKLNNPNYENRAFLEDFAKKLDEPLAQINIRV